MNKPLASPLPLYILLGVVVCIGYILQQLDMLSVIFPLIVLLEFVILMSLFLSSYAGFESAQVWLR
jgi:hypothetical protein